MENKFSFDTAFQEEGIRFVLNNQDGVEAMDFIKASYFDLLDHSIIFHGIEVFYKKNGRIPSKPFLRNVLMELFSTQEYRDSLTKDEENSIFEKLEDLYSYPAKDGDLLLNAFTKFSAFVELQKLNEETDLDNFNNYERYASRVNEIVDKGLKGNKSEGIFLIKDIKERQMKRQASDLIIATPYYQLNQLSSAGGFEPGSILVLLDRPKKSKTTFLVNTARKYMASKVKVLYIDLENGETSIAARLEQSIGRVNKKEIIKGSSDKHIQKILRRYRRLGGEVFIRRLPAFSTTNEIQKIIDQHYRKYGYRFGALMIDYLALMGSISGKKDDFDRISDAYVDVANLMNRNPSIAHCWTANHVVRGAKKKEATRYSDDDIAKCIDIVRHAQGIYGLNRTALEAENNIMRLEIVVQREGVPAGRAYFRVFADLQRVDELTKKEIQELTQQGILYNPDEYREEESSKDSDRRNGDI